MKDIEGYKGLYAITRDGRVWSYPKRVNSFQGSWMRLYKFVNIKNRITPHIQYTVALSKEGVCKRRQVHRLVAQTYILNPDNKPQVNHIDGDPLNNHVDNLEWVTGFENMQHAQKTGLTNQHTKKSMANRSLQGKKNWKIAAKAHRMFTMEEAAKIREYHKSNNKSCRAIAKELRCSNKTISNICNNTTYQVDI